MEYEISPDVRAALRSRVLDFLKSNAIPYTLYEHPVLSTVEECLSYWGNIPDATHCKNLFFRNHKGNRHYLVTMECHKSLDIHDLEHALHQGKLSFASPERMMRCLGTFPGAVSAFGLISDMCLSAESDPSVAKEVFDNGHRVKYFIDNDLKDAGKISFHPCDNSASVVISGDDFQRFLALWGGEADWIEV